MFMSILTVSRSNSGDSRVSGYCALYDTNRSRGQRNHPTRRICRIESETRHSLVQFPKSNGKKSESASHTHTITRKREGGGTTR